MLEQHPVPQNVTSFQFRLIGDMTLKQFGYLAAGLILAYIAYHLPLPFFFTWPLTAICALGGVGFAFVPVEERPMDVWFVSFIKSIYSPTLYIWQRDLPSDKPVATGLASIIPTLPLPVAGKAATATLPTKNSSAGAKSIWETFFAKKSITQPNKVTVPAVSQPIAHPTAVPQPKPPQIPQQQHTQPVQHPAPVQMKVAPPAPQQQPPTPQVQVQPPPPQAPKREEHSQDSALQLKLEEALQDKKRLEEELASIKKMLLAQQTPSQPPTPPAPLPQQVNKPSNAFLTRTAPNVITGVVRQHTGELLNSILVTVKDKDEIPLRALKTNKTGQFAASTPLPNGTYSIEVEDPKGTFFFQPVSITLNGSEVPPVSIVAKTKQDLDRQKLADALFGKQG